MAKVQPGKLPDETRLKEKKGAENFFWRMTMGSVIVHHYRKIEHVVSQPGCVLNEIHNRSV